MALGFTHLLGLFGLLQAISAAPATACQLQWGDATIDGHLGDNNVCRYNIKYGSAERWGESQAVTSPADGTGLPPACAQPGTDFIGGVSMSEDCLHMLAYVPQNADAHTPIFTWLHGGSFRMGGTSMPGIDGSALAAKGQVVFVPQYRLGLLGMMPPAGSPAASDPNLAIRDVVLALKSIQSNIGSKGNKNAVTLGGHSSGATIARSLWASPSASGLFHRTMLQSDPSGHGLSTMAKFNQVRDDVYGYDVFNGAKSFADLKKLDVSYLTDAVNVRLSKLIYRGWLDSPDAFLNPVSGTKSIPQDALTALSSSGLVVEPKSMPLFVSNTKDEGAYFVGGARTQPYPGDGSPDLGGRGHLQRLTGLCANGENMPLFNVADYTWSRIVEAPADQGRTLLSRVVSDGYFRCSARSVASSWAKRGGEAYVAEFNAGAPFLYSQGVSFCDGKVCHGDDVPLGFGHDNNGPAGLGDEVADIWSAFIQGKQLGWNSYKADANQQNTNVKAIGGGEIRNCPADVWGSQCPWFWQKSAGQTPTGQNCQGKKKCKKSGKQ